MAPGLFIAICAALSATVCFFVAAFLEQWLAKRRQWLFEYGPSEYSKKPVTDSEKLSCTAYLRRVSRDDRLSRDMRARIVYGFAQQDFKVLAEVYAEMLEGKQANEDVLDFLSTELREVGRRPAVYASLQKFLSYLNSPRLDKYARAVLSRNVQDFSENVRFYNQRKRLVDLVVSLFLILFLSPVFLAVAILLWWDTPQPVVRKARYLGLHGKPFNYYMFRTFPSLLQGALSESHLKLADSYPKEVLEQYTNESWVRRGLIRWNLYRLPALLNVLKGEMSLIGPTPLSLHEFPSLSTQQAFSNLPKHLSVRPGAIGKAQLRAYLSPPLTWDEAMEIDRDYLSTLSARSDLQILRQAIRVYLSNTQRNLRDLFHPGRHDWFQRTLTRLADG